MWIARFAPWLLLAAHAAAQDALPPPAPLPPEPPADQALEAALARLATAESAAATSVRALHDAALPVALVGRARAAEKRLAAVLSEVRDAHVYLVEGTKRVLELLRRPAPQEPPPSGDALEESMRKLRVSLDREMIEAIPLRLKVIELACTRLELERELADLELGHLNELGAPAAQGGLRGALPLR